MYEPARKFKMEIIKPKPKKNSQLKQSDSSGLHNFVRPKELIQGIFNGFSVIIEKQEDMEKLTSMGYFGKSSFSRNQPQFRKNAPLLRNRVFQNRKQHFNSNTAVQSVITVPDSDSETEVEAYFTNFTPTYQIDKSGIRETLNLNLEEAFYLASALKCLMIKQEDSQLNQEELWSLFKQIDTNFIINYIVYYYLRSKNWVVKPGIKFGGDFLIYQEGPEFYHASYVVIIHVVDEHFKTINSLSRRSMTYVSLAGLNRLCETAGKELMICEVIYPTELEIDTVMFTDLPKFTIKETIMKRWLPTQNK